MSNNRYEPTIGIETHVQLNTKTKLFSAVGNDARQAAANQLISHIDTGMPGALPVLNKSAISLSVMAAFALKTRPQKFSKFDRKHYFYPDLPKGYQITQYEDPIIKGGHVDINVNGKIKQVKITRVHLEEDAGKNTHPAGADYSLVDLNRAGTPLLEIVSEPDIHSAAEAKAYARELYLLMKYAGVSDVDLYHGNMRFDVNVSINKPGGAAGTRTETKNLNSFRSVENAVTYEIKRQTELLDKGDVVIQETRGWDEAKQKTFSQRGKEEAEDYRYMPEPDIPPLELTDEWIDEIKHQLPELPQEIRQKLARLSIEPKVIEDILDNQAVYSKVSEALATGASPEAARRLAFDSLEEPKTLKVPVAEHIKVAEMLIDKKISSNTAKDILVKKTENPGVSVEKLAEDRQQLTDESLIEKIVADVLVQNPKAAQDIKQGEMKAIGFLVGQIMQRTQGQADPQLAQQIIKRQLGL